ncbi:MAG: NAD(P)-dependent oxidoreductase [Chitinophagaceae bacterium]|nr:MAG: NAD(P)-dependent oxidoreductase [Chitinophagaceae bacterium]
MAVTNNRLSAAEYERNFSDVHPPFDSREAALVDANRCLMCYDAPCTKSCPTSIDIPKFIQQITTNNVKGSARTILQSNIMGAGCSRVCPVEKLCEGSCVYNFLHEAPIPIAKLQRYSTEMALEKQWQLFTRKPDTGRRVAIVGAGPAGLSCAHVLAREGVDVTIYEKEATGGGLMTYGIAAYKVTPEFCRQEVDYITSIGGISIRYGQELGRDISLAQLRADYDAVFLGFGVGLARRLDIPGEELGGVVDAISFIYQLRTNPLPHTAVGDRVVVIGLGMTAIDAATQAKRLGAKDVTIVYRRTREEMPCTQVELDLALMDGCQVLWLAAPKEVLGTDGQVSGLRCSQMKLGDPDASGRRAPVPSGEEFVLEADMVIKAAGQTPFEAMVETCDLQHSNGKVVVANNGTSIGGVFAGGDCVNGGREVVDAVQAGKEGAAAIMDYLDLHTEVKKNVATPEAII